MSKGSSAKIILIVEDEFDNREIMRAVVEDLLGYTAILVSDGKLALQAISESIPDLILMDLMMPVLDGFEVIKHVRSTPEMARTPILAVSALSRPIDRDRALASGADDYLGKPFDIEHLTSMIEHYVSSV